MSIISNILSLTEKNGLNLWTIDTTQSNIMGCERHPKLIEEIANWEIHKSFVDKYGLMLTLCGEDYISIYILSRLLRKYNLICLPNEQGEESSLNKLNLETDEVNWILKTCIYYDENFNYIVDHEDFQDSGYFPPFK